MPMMARSVDQIDPILRRIIRALVMGEEPWPLFIHGPVGTGKSCAALCLLDHTMGGGMYYTVSGLCALLIQSQQGRLERSYELCHGETIFPDKLWKWIASAKLVVLDEIGCRDSVSDHHYDAVKQCIDERERKPFIAISNLSPDKLARTYDDRIFSRLARGTVFTLEGKDRRLQ